MKLRRVPESQESFDDLAFVGGLTMYTSRIDLAERVVRRFLKSRSETDPHDHALVWQLPAPFPNIPDDIVVQCSDGCVVTTQDIEESIGKNINIVQGSCRFSDVHADDGVNRVRFQVRKVNGKLLRGTVTVNVVAREDQLTAFSKIELDGEGTLISNPG